MSETALAVADHEPPFVTQPCAIKSQEPVTVMPRRRDRSRSRFERVALGSYRPDPPRLLTLGFELSAEPANVLGHGRRVLPFLGRMPNLVEEERSGEDSTWRGSEKRQEVELASRQFDKVPTHEHPPRIEINTK